MPIWHIVIVAVGRRAFYPSEAALLAGLTAIVRCTAGRLLLFCIVDDHIHVVVETDHPGDLESALGRSLAATTPVGLESAHRTPVEDAAHLRRLVPYLLIQPEKHGMRVHPALWPGSCFLDLVGVRRLPGLELRLESHLQRFDPADAFRVLQLPTAPLTVPTRMHLRRLGASRIVRAAAAAPGVALPLGRDPAASAARRAAAAVATAAGIAPLELAFALGVHVRSAQRLMRHEPDRDLCRAPCLYLALEELVAARRTEPRRQATISGVRCRIRTELGGWSSIPEVECRIRTRVAGWLSIRGAGSEPGPGRYRLLVAGEGLEPTTRGL
jgi:REP element-mobilizing transposase RayT